MNTLLLKLLVILSLLIGQLSCTSLVVHPSPDTVYLGKVVSAKIGFSTNNPVIMIETERASIVAIGDYNTYNTVKDRISIDKNAYWTKAIAEVKSSYDWLWIDGTDRSLRILYIMPVTHPEPKMIIPEQPRKQLTCGFTFKRKRRVTAQCILE